MKKIITAIVALAALSLTQVHAEVSTKDSISTQKSFKQSVTLNELKKAFESAAAETSWKVTGEDATGMSLEKKFTQKSKYYNHAAYRGKREIITEYVALQIRMDAKGFQMELSVNDKESKIAKEAKDELEELKQSVFKHLAMAQL